MPAALPEVSAGAGAGFAAAEASGAGPVGEMAGSGATTAEELNATVSDGYADSADRRNPCTALLRSPRLPLMTADACAVVLPVAGRTMRRIAREDDAAVAARRSCGGSTSGAGGNGVATSSVTPASRRRADAATARICGE